MEKKSEYSYSIGRMEAALLNADHSLPSPCDWEDTNPKTGEKRIHLGGIVGKSGTFNFKELNGDDFKIGVLYGTKKAEFTLTGASTSAGTTVNGASSGTNTNTLKKENVTVDELVKAFTTGFTELESKGIKLKAEKTTSSNGYDAEYLKITTKTKDCLPFFAPIGFSGKIPELLGITGWVASKEAKSFKDDFEKESGKSVDATSGHGIQCTVKEPDKIKGVNVTASFATIPNKFFAMVTGHSYNEKTGELYIDNAGNPPLIALRYFVEQYESGINTKGSFSRVKAFIFPSCQITPGGNEASEDNFAAQELQGTGGDNKRSNLPFKFIKEISLADYKAHVGDLN